MLEQTQEQGMDLNPPEQTPNPPEIMETKKHSGLGIASFVISLLTGIFMFMMFVVAGVVETSTPGGMDEESASAMIIGMLIILALMIAVMSLGLGIAALVQRHRKKVFAILGVVFSALILFGTLGLIAVGLALE